MLITQPAIDTIAITRTFGCSTKPLAPSLTARPPIPFWVWRDSAWGIAQCIVDMNRGIKPDLTIVDGSVGQDGERPLCYEACPEHAISIKGYSGTRGISRPQW